MTASFLFFADIITPTTSIWHPSVAVVMILANIFAIAVGYFAIQKTGIGPSLPVPQLASQKNFGVSELLATTSLGHILGAGLILGLSSAGIL